MPDGSGMVSPCGGNHGLLGTAKAIRDLDLDGCFCVFVWEL